MKFSAYSEALDEEQGRDQVGYNAGLSRRRSRVRVPSAPPNSSHPATLALIEGLASLLNEHDAESRRAALHVVARVQEQLSFGPHWSKSQSEQWPDPALLP